MKTLRHALFAILLLLAQSGALTHAVEHLRIDDADSPAHHACTLCLAAQGLDAALTATPAIPPVRAARQAPPAFAALLSAPATIIYRRARAPPDA